jgi:hypothetical protein
MIHVGPLVSMRINRETKFMDVPAVALLSGSKFCAEKGAKTRTIAGGRTQ